MLHYTETVVAIAIAVLTAVFIGALVVLIVICKRQQYYYKKKYCDKPDDIVRPDVLLIEPERPDLELGEVRLSPDLEQILADEQWIDDATGLVPHCIAILKTCHTLTERLTTLAMGPLHSNTTGHQIVEAARKISSHVDDVVRSMYPPLDPRLLEARTAALILAVTHLALITRYECGRARSMGGWIDKSLLEMDTHLLVLREAALTQEAATRIQNLSSNTKL